MVRSSNVNRITLRNDAEFYFSLNLLPPPPKLGLDVDSNILKEAKLEREESSEDSDDPEYGKSSGPSLTRKKKKSKSNNKPTQLLLLSSGEETQTTQEMWGNTLIESNEIRVSSDYLHQYPEVGDFDLGLDFSDDFGGAISGGQASPEEAPPEGYPLKDRPINHQELPEYKDDRFELNLDDGMNEAFEIPDFPDTFPNTQLRADGDLHNSNRVLDDDNTLNSEKDAASSNVLAHGEKLFVDDNVHARRSRRKRRCEYDEHPTIPAADLRGYNFNYRQNMNLILMGNIQKKMRASYKTTKASVQQYARIALDPLVNNLFGQQIYSMLQDSNIDADNQRLSIANQSGNGNFGINWFPRAPEIGRARVPSVENARSGSMTPPYSMQSNSMRIDSSERSRRLGSSSSLMRVPSAGAFPMVAHIESPIRAGMESFDDDGYLDLGGNSSSFYYDPYQAVDGEDLKWLQERGIDLGGPSKKDQKLADKLRTQYRKLRQKSDVEGGKYMKLSNYEESESSSYSEEEDDGSNSSKKFSKTKFTNHKMFLKSMKDTITANEKEGSISKKEYSSNNLLINNNNEFVPFEMFVPPQSVSRKQAANAFLQVLILTTKRKAKVYQEPSESRGFNSTGIWVKVL